ncbi:hypothetical protein [Thermococcus aciditolerans]|uniref:Class III signal peptide-containing protein n=1 Tax=Thermococcus aciditolerans TaxID=2598455 RepID=A0A5C0SKQ3_9EURY|nr:hypothetical protein [Thermococcus aciditolerans]QEK14327.1 hypothetical protein FPV09_03520 [Thermococcus aciditolerans]
MRAQSSLEYLFMLASMFILVFVTLFAYNRGVLPHTIETGEQVNILQLQNDAQYIVVQLKANGLWEKLKSKTVTLSESNGETTCSVDGTSYSGTHSGVIDYSTDGKTLEEIYNDCMNGNAGACEVIICSLGAD